jgi:hypothetical protein
VTQSQSDVHSDDTVEFDVMYQEGSKSDPNYWERYFDKGEMGAFMYQAYESPDGYAIRTNPLTGKTEMFVAGTHNPFKKGEHVKGAVEWLQNVSETVGHVADGFKDYLLEPVVDAAETFLIDSPELIPLSNHIIEKYIPDPSVAIEFVDGRDAYANKLQGIADNHDPPVDVVIGHSRGSAIISGFDDNKYQLISLDGATFIGKHSGHNLFNIRTDDAFDKTLSIGHQNTLTLKGKGFHSVVTERKEKRKRSTSVEPQRKEKRKRSKKKTHRRDKLKSKKLKFSR